MRLTPVVSFLALAAPTWSLPPGYPTIPMRGVDGNIPMPLVGVGTWQYNSSLAERVVEVAFKSGFRHVDTAWVYKNQDGVGRALLKSGLPREDYFITTKIPGGLNASATRAYLDECLQLLNHSYVDLLLIHFPASFEGKGGPALRKEEWLTLEKWALEGKAKAIGVSHYCKSHVDDVLSVATLPIALNQVMYHVGMGMSPDAATDYKDYMQQLGIVYMSFSTLCGPCDGDDPEVLTEGPLVTEIGKKHGKTGAQVALRWAVQQGVPVIPKSQNPKHLEEDFDLFSFELSENEMDRLSSSTTPATGAKDSGDCEIGLYDDADLRVTI